MNPVCSNNCLYDLPEVSYNTCAPKVFQSQLRRILVGKANAAPLDDWKQAASYTNRVSQNNKAGNDYIRAITCTGDKPAPSNNTKSIENQQLIQINKTHIVNFSIFQISDDNYEFMRGSECGTIVRLFMFETMGGVAFGSNEGQLVSLVMDDVLTGGDEDLETITGQMQWKSKFSLERTSVSPIFDIDYNAAVAAGLFDTLQSFIDATEANSEGVNTTVPAISANAKFEFNKLVGLIGAPTTMTLKLAGATVAIVDFPSDYTGSQFKFTDDASVVHTGVFTAGNVVLPA